MNKNAIFNLLMLASLFSLVACNFEGSADVKANASLSNEASSSTVSDDKLFGDEAQKEGCTTEEDLEAQIEKAATQEAPTLMGATDPGCEVK